MRLKVITISAAIFVCVGTTFSTDVMAIQRRFVSGNGSDVNPCSRALPCRTLQAGVDAVDPGGEVVPLDSAGYGGVLINKSVSIVTPPGIIASITVLSGNAVEVSAADTDIVVLRGLSITGLGLGSFGIFYDSGGTLIVEGVTASGFLGDGLNASTSTLNSVLVVKRSSFRGNGGDGMDLRAGAGSLTGTINEVFATDNDDDGMDINSDDVDVTVKNSVATGNGDVGFSNQNADSRMDMENCVATGNLTGVDGVLVGEFTGNIRVSNSTITANGTGIGTDVISRQNNTVEGNGINGGFAGFFNAK